MRPLIALGVVLGAGCGPGAHTVPATLKAARQKATLSADFSPLELRVTLGVSGAQIENTYEPTFSSDLCAVFGPDLAAELDGVPLVVKDRGTSYVVPGLMSWQLQSHGCNVPTFTMSLPPPPASGVVSTLVVHDSTDRFELQAEAVFAPRSLVWLEPQDGAVRAGQRASLSWSPSTDVRVIPGDAQFRRPLADGGAAGSLAFADGGTYGFSESDDAFDAGIVSLTIPEFAADAGVIGFYRPYFFPGTPVCDGPLTCDVKVPDPEFVGARFTLVR